LSLLVIFLSFSFSLKVFREVSPNPPEIQFKVIIYSPSPYLSLLRKRGIVAK
jgi:hypothetical protein